MFTRPSRSLISHLEAALLLRVGLGAVFIIGGYNKLSQLLDPAREASILAAYTGPLGYINTFFAEFLFSGPFGSSMTPWGFLTALSSFELASGFALLAGLMVRPLSLMFAFMIWSFVFALPVVTTPGVGAGIEAIHAPAMLVQVRDIAMSGMMFVLYNLGSGAQSVDAKIFGEEAQALKADWESLGLLLRLSLGLPLLVGGVFAGMDHIQSFASDPVLLMAIGAMVALGIAPRFAGLSLSLVVVWYVSQRLNLEASLIANLNWIKREFAFVAAGAVLALAGGGSRFTPSDLWARMELLRCILQLKHFGRRCLPRFGQRIGL